MQGSASPAPPGANMLLAEQCNSITDVRVVGLAVNGSTVLSDLGWRMSRIGNVSPITYREQLEHNGLRGVAGDPDSYPHS